MTRVLRSRWPALLAAFALVACDDGGTETVDGGTIVDLGTRDSMPDEPDMIPADMTVPDPDMTVPDPDMTVPDPDMTVPDPDMTVPDPDMGCVPAAETCNGLDDDCDGVIDNGFEGVGDACSVGVGACAADGALACADDGARVVCAAEAGLPGDELCSGIDEDCDGNTDEGFEGLGEPCSTGEGACEAAGTTVCGPDGAATICDAVAGEPGDEACDGLDNDCDGNADEGLGGVACETGVPGECAAGVTACVDGVAGCQPISEPRPEACDGADNDCNGVIDDVEGLGEDCSAGVGACAAAGALVCTPAGLACDAIPGDPGVEVCDGADTDCNGVVDDVAGVGEDCAAGVGACEAAGTVVCTPDGPACDAVAGDPGVEVCDGADTDCNGVIDDVAGVGEACAAGVGACEVAGRVVCTPDGPACDAVPGAPGVEVCDGADTDCNGAIDDVAGVGEACTAGVGACATAGTVVCSPEGPACDAIPGAPEPEACNEIDDDCNGVVDDEPVCAVVEDCDVEGDEDGNGQADCDDAACVDRPQCQPIIGVCSGIALPADPRGFVANADIGARGWLDGGNDAFDTYGRLTLTANGVDLALDMSLGRHQGEVGGIGFVAESQLNGNVWTYTVAPTDPANAGAITVVMNGNLGSDGNTQRADLIGAGGLPILLTTDGAPTDPPVYTALVPANPDVVVDYDTARIGLVTATAADITLPVTLVVALSYAEDRQAVADAISAGCLGSICGDFEMPEDPEGYTPNNDIGVNGWTDAGQDAFDTYGRITVTANGEDAALDMSLGEREGLTGGIGYSISSVLEGNVWRYIITPTDPANAGPIDVVMTGNLGSDANTQRTDLLGGGVLPVLVTTEGPIDAPTDPPVFTALVPADRGARPDVVYAVNRDSVTVTANAVELPITLVVAVTFADPQAVADALAAGCNAGVPDPPAAEDCAVEGDEDGNGDADCADAACADFPACLVEDCAVEGDENGNGLADCADAACVDEPACQAAVAGLIPGPQQNVPVADVQARGWQQCFIEPYNTTGTAVADILAGCPGTQLMLGCRQTGADVLTLAGEGLRDDVTMDVGQGNVTHNHNGLQWYYDDTDSWGFAPDGAAVNRASCDTVNGEGRLCWHTQAAGLTGGYRCGATEGLNASVEWERVIYVRSEIALGVNQAFGHHGSCQGFDDCGGAENCANLACTRAGHGAATRWEEGMCRALAAGGVPDVVCSLFRDQDPNNLDEGWGPPGPCEIPVVYDVNCTPAVP